MRYVIVNSISVCKKPMEVNRKNSQCLNNSLRSVCMCIFKINIFFIFHRNISVAQQKQICIVIYPNESVPIPSYKMNLSLYLNING